MTPSESPVSKPLKPSAQMAAADALDIYAFEGGKRPRKIFSLRRRGAKGKPLRIVVASLDAIRRMTLDAVRGRKRTRTCGPSLWIVPSAMTPALTAWLQAGLEPTPRNGR